MEDGDKHQLTLSHNAIEIIHITMATVPPSAGCYENLLTFIFFDSDIKV